MVGIEGCFPGIGLIAHACHPATQLIAFDVGVFAVGLIVTARDESVEEILEAMGRADGGSLSALVDVIARAAKLRAHLQSHLHCKRIESLRLADHDVAGLAMVQSMAHIQALLSGERAPPVVVGIDAVTYMSFHVNPTLEQWQRPVFRQCNSYLWYGPGIDA